MVLREPMNGLTHFVGILFGIAALTLLVKGTLSPIQPWHLAGFTVFGVGMVLLYTASTLYHWLPLTQRGVQIWRRIDHSMIFVYIAATYTPICLIPLRGPWGWTLLGIVWGVAVAGLFVKIFWMDAPRWLSTALYLGMGWIVVIALYPLVQSLPIPALLWLLAGGLLYSAGAVVYALKRPRGFRFLGFHEIFHLFVIAGSLCHFWLMYRYIAEIV